uniref:Uncharacterized protein n=1 Tax=Anguilla anguilla TaxID=7936 RepID=A0A0E9UBJ3_ANGAN
MQIGTTRVTQGNRQL